MLAMPIGTPACPDAGRQRRLAAQLADMIAGAATIRVSLNDPKQTWPHQHAVVNDETRKITEMGRATVRGAGRWILRVWPGGTRRDRTPSTLPTPPSRAAA
ncbi:transcriptional regulator [Streptomyces vietnamensis]|uniref:transcriptional regulator n=1 Tax=Streptomyces vietnamensis TaxID=362257 RepID=UPI000B2C361A|nr:transcriptional regulator [Streptomyces vietnamensis]